MKFTNEQMDLLKKCWENQEVVTIEGVNGFGQRFITQGRITTTDLGKAGIFPDTIYVEFGKTKENPEKKQTIYFAPYRTETDGIGVLGLYIYKIRKENQEVIFENTEYRKLVTNLFKKAIKEIKSLKKDGRMLEENDMDNVTEKLQSFIGKPIILDGLTGVVISANRYANSGKTVVNLAQGPGCCNDFVSADSVLKTENLDGEIVKIAENNFADTLVKINNRANKITQKMGYTM